MVDAKLIVNGMDVSGKLLTYSVNKDISYRKVIITLDELEHPYPGGQKTVITFSLLPLTDEETAQLYDALRVLVFNAAYTDPYSTVNEDEKRVRVISGLESAFALRSVDGKRRYTGGKIQLREL